LFKFESMSAFYDLNESLYIELSISKRKLYLIIHDDGYTQGSKDKVITLLEEKGIGGFYEKNN